MKSSSSHKKRKSDVHLDSSTAHPMKKERPWYAEEASLDNKLAPEKDRRKSLIGIGKGLFKKMRSSSALKDRSNRDTSLNHMSASTSAMPILRQLPASTLLGPMPEDQSFQSESSSVASSDNSLFAVSFQRNKDLMGLVAHTSVDKQSDQSSEQGGSIDDESSLSRDKFYIESAASLCTPSNDFGRGKLSGSVRSMPTESDLFRGLCNSAIRRTFSSASDSLSSPQRFTRARSIRLREKLALSASMAELPEEEVQVTTSTVGDNSEIVTPNTEERSSRRASIVWSTLRSKSRIFSSKKQVDGAHHCNSSIECAETQENVTPLGRNLRRTSASSASIHKKVSSAIKKGFGLRGSSTNINADPIHTTPAGILKRSSTNSKDRNRFSKNIARRCSDVSGVAISELERQVRIEQKKKDAEEAKMYMEKIIISGEPVMKMLHRNIYDAVVIDVSATGLPVSSVAKQILDSDSGTELHKIGMFNPYRNGVLRTPCGKPDIIYIVSEKDELADKRVRIGVVNGMREAFADGNLKKLIAYPFCLSHEEEFTDYVIQQFLLASYKGFIWNQKAKTFEGTMTLAGVSEENCLQIRRLYEELLKSEIRPKIAAYENLALPLSEQEQGV